MELDRRTMLVSGAVLAAAPALGKAKADKAGWYDQAIIIDALGGLGDPYVPDEQLRLGDRAWSEMVATGVTLLRDTVFPVGNPSDPWGDYQRDIALKQNIFNANPDKLVVVRSAADILKAKREKKFAWLYGTQDTSMVGPDLDRLAQLKKDGVMTVQLTYNTATWRATGRWSRPMPACRSSAAQRSSGSKRRSSCSIFRMAARKPWPRRQRMPSGRW